MKDYGSVLAEWIIQYLQHRDILLQSIQEVKREGDTIKVIYKDKKLTLFLLPVIDSVHTVVEKLDGVSGEEIPAIVVLNIKSNIDSVIKNWQRLVGYKKLTMYFVNPEAKETDRKWILQPYTHNQICDEESLELGLRSLFQSVEEVAL